LDRLEGKRGRASGDKEEHDALKGEREREREMRWSPGPEWSPARGLGRGWERHEKGNGSREPS
jgi:hypothetical protein